MSKDIQKEENKELSKLVDINKDACEFYESASEKAENPHLKTTFSNLERLHNSVMVNLQTQIRANGGELDADETFMGGARQFFGELVAKVSNDVDEALVTHLEEAEDRCLHSIKDAMESDDITSATKTVLRDEMQTLQKSHDYMKSLKEHMKAA
jgi:uncharacterized protein (TIGR02284 family)